MYIVHYHVVVFARNSTAIPFLTLEACYFHLSTYPTESRQILLLAVNAVREDFLKATSNLYYLTHVTASFFCG